MRALPPARHQALDLARLLAISLVAVQHVLSLLGREADTTWDAVNVGQLGVALFLAISGYLAGPSRRGAADWLRTRVRRVYPAYAIAMVVSLALARLSGYKAFSPFQAVSQMLALGLFTHPRTLVNVPTWFMSLLLVCYLATFVTKLFRRPALALTIAGTLAAAGIVCAGNPWPWYHLHAYFATAVLATALPPRRVPASLLACAVALLAMAWWSPVYAYTGLAVLATAGATLPLRLPRIARTFAEYSFEFYLLHGIGVLGALTLLPTHPAFAIIGGLAISAVGAVFLKTFVDLALGVPEGRVEPLTRPRAPERAG